MAPLNLTADEKLAALEKGSSEIRFLMERNNVDNDIQAMLYHSGICTLPVLATIASSAGELKTLVKDEFGVDSDANLAARVRVANLIVAWENATVRARKQSEVEGELGTKHLVKPITNSDYIAMRQSWETRYWPIEEEYVPARAYLEKRAEELEQDDLKAEPLTAVITKDQEDPDVLIPVWSSTGVMTMKKGSQAAEEPKTPEQLRKRLKVMMTGIMFLALKHTNRKFLQGINPQLCEDYVTYLLSDHCYLLQGRTADGFNIPGPSWQQLLVYEFQIRRKAWILVQGGADFKDALRQSWQDPVIKERFLTTPVALSSSHSHKRTWEHAGDSGNGGKKSGGKGNMRGGSKGKGKGGKGGKSATERLNIASRTPGGEPICFSYNDFNVRCKNKKCRFKHVCGACFDKHPIYACRAGVRPAETQGGGKGSD